MKAANIITFSVLSIFSILLLAWIIPAYCPPYTGEGIPASLLPSSLAWIILCLSVFLLAMELRRKKTDMPSPLGFSQLITMLQYLGIFTACLLVMAHFGYIASAVVTLALLQVMMRQKRLVPFVLIVALVPAALYYAITYGLRVPLP